MTVAAIYFSHGQEAMWPEGPLQADGASVYILSNSYLIASILSNPKISTLVVVIFTR